MQTRPFPTAVQSQKQAMERSTKTSVKVAVTQAEPVWLDLDATVEKTCLLISEAAKNGAQVVVLPVSLKDWL